MGNGDIDLDVVLRVLQACGVAVSQQPEKDLFTFEKDDIIEVYELDPTVKRRMIQRFSRKFNIPIHYFYNPRQVPPGKITC
jgi:hypothetical protein